MRGKFRRARNKANSKKGGKTLKCTMEFHPFNCLLLFVVLGNIAIALLCHASLIMKEVYR